jgi:hypothetical protein
MLSKNDLVALVNDLEKSQKNPNANLTIYLGGLAIGHKGNKSWRSVFLDGVPSHDLQMAVFRLKGQTYEVSRWTDVADRFPLSIVADGVQEQTSNYRPTDASDHSSYTHLGNFNEIHAEQPRFKNPDGLALRRLEILGGEGFTAKLADDGETRFVFHPRGEDPPEDATGQLLGTWLGINHTVEEGRSVKTSGWDGEINLSVCDKGSKVIILVTNNCLRDHGCSESLDFCYYYHESDKPQKGVIAGTPYVLKPNLVDKGDRIACNKMMIDDLGGLSSLFDLEG